MAEIKGAQPTVQCLDIRDPSAVGAARRAAKIMAKALGFDAQACEEIGLAATELASNLIKHAHGGRLVLSPLAQPERIGLQLEARDEGPGIVNIEQALADGYSTTGSLGAGLGAINRLMDELDIESPRGRGTRILCRKWLRAYQASARPCPLAFGAATRPMTFGTPNGDEFVIKLWAGSALVGIMDGLGHGQYAHRAARAARQYVETHYDQPLGAIFRGAGRACRATRGLVMALARFDWEHGRLAFASVGNIEARVLTKSSKLQFRIRRGIIGVNAPNAVVTEHDWEPDNVLVLHSDGLSTHWHWRDFPQLMDQPATLVAQTLLQALAKDQDDATVIVVAKARP